MAAEELNCLERYFTGQLEKNYRKSKTVDRQTVKTDADADTIE
jgi:hypothetical protein